MRNLNLLFYKTYYNSIGAANFDDNCLENNEKIASAQFCNDYDDKFSENFDSEKFKSFCLVSAYPGLVVGTGYTHGVSSANNDIKVGFSFDYVTGQPYIPASSVKGILRSVFRDHPGAISQIITEVFKKDLPTDKVAALEQSIFEDSDVFFDAVVCEGSAVNNRFGGNLMDFDSITPHKDITQNPVPLNVLRIMPGVKIQFRFYFKDSKDVCGLNAEEKKTLFKEILKLFGIGAKTNVGYGNLVEADDTIVNRPVVEENHSTANQQRSGNQQQRNNNRNNNNYRNNNQHNNNQAGKIPCPHCGRPNYRRNRNGSIAQTCYVCFKPLNQGGRR